MRFVTFNICGINNVLSYHPWNDHRSFAHMFETLEADVICLQETKLQPQLLKREHCLVPGYDSYWSFSSVKKGYSGVVIYVKHGIDVKRAEEGITGQLLSPDSKKGFTYQQLYERQTERDGTSKSCIGGYPEGDSQRLYQVDSEGRSILLDLGFCVLFGLYCPSTATDGEERDMYRNDYFSLLEQRVSNLIEAGRQVVVMGDLNVAAQLYDSAEGMQALHKAKQITLPSLGDKEEGRFVQAFEKLNPEQCERWRDARIGRQVFHRLVPELLQDSCRLKHPQRPDMYTCWNVMLNYRPGNFGSRIDYVLASRGLEVHSADILPALEGSDHCPVYAVISEKTDLETSMEPQIIQHETGSLSEAAPAPKSPAPPPAFRPKLFHKTDRVFKTASVLSMFRPVSKGITKPKPKPVKKQAAISSFFASNSTAGQTLNIDSTRDAGMHAGVGGDNTRPTEIPAEEWSEIEERVLEAEKVANQWSRIMTKKPAPRCDHNLPAILRTTRKKGPNHGKHFWVCGQNHSLQLVGDGQKGDGTGVEGSQDDTTTRCGFFQWK